MHQHLADCTDCRVLEQRAGRLQRLLALKRYERPTPEYFDNFLSEFHGRIQAEARKISWWERVLGRVDDFLAAESMRVWRYSFTSALGVAAVVGLTHSTPQTIAASLPNLSSTASADYLSASAGSVVLVPAQAHTDSSTPGYVLDHIPVTPASYDVPSVHF